MIDYGALMVAKVLSHVGERESPMGSNRGPEVDQYNLHVGNSLGSAWCAAAACSWAWDVRQETGANFPVPNTGSSGGIADWGEEHNAGVSGADVVPGCIGAVINPDTDTGHCHTVVAVAVNIGNQTVDTVEGNEGNGVRRETRGLYDCDWVRWWPDV